MKATVKFKRWYLLVVGLATIVVCLFFYFVGYTHGYKTAGYTYYYDEMKVKYAFWKVERNYERMKAMMDSTAFEYSKKQMR